VSSEISEAKKKYSDFEQMMPKMAELNKEVKGVSVDELYFLAKVRSGLPLVTQEKIETERPDGSQSAANARPRYKRPENIRGGRGMQDILSAALKNREFES
jgi:hypothetical protein